MASYGTTRRHHINMQSSRSLDSSCLALVLLSTLPKWHIVATMPTSSPLSSLSTSAVAALRAGEGSACSEFRVYLSEDKNRQAGWDSPTLREQQGGACARD